MSLKKFRPVTPSLRHTVSIDRSSLWKGKPLKSLTTVLNYKAGRNSLGHITVRGRGGRAKVKYRIIDFKRKKDDIKAYVERIEYDPNRTPFIALIKYEDGESSYIIAPEGLNVGDEIFSGPSSDIKIGNCLPMRNIPVGTLIHNIELRPNKGAQICRTAGGFVQLIGKSSGYATLKLRSSEIRLIPLDCRATIGVVSNSDHQNVKYGKAGKMRYLGFRPKVRGVAMNPIDHPHGGGEGKTSGGRHPVTPWGKHTKGKKTRKNKSTQKYILRKRK